MIIYNMKLYLFAVLTCLVLSSSAQTQSQQDKQRQEMIEEAEERKNQYINDFVSTLNVDEFQQVIIKQTMESYYSEWTKIAQYQIPVYQKKTLVEELDATHFNDLKTIVSDEVYQKVKEGVKMENYKDIQKKIKKSKKKRKNQKQLP